MPFKVGDVFGATSAVRGVVSGTNAQRAVACSCPACTGLECLERPRFFAGQLLSEAELNGEMSYILAKQRLHNRYLHGIGTVCGLEVVCSNCAGQVVIKPGYAIDPCGNDIVVCQEQQFDVLKAIQACCDAVKKKNKTICDPYQPYNPGCTGQEQHWCITIAYTETPTQPVTPLRAKSKTCSCAGSCSSVGSCGCSSSNGNTSSNGCTPAASAPTTTSTACEPTRILESFTLGVVPDPGTCTTSDTVFEGTLLGKIVQCLSPLLQIRSALSGTTYGVLQLSISKTLPDSQTLNSDAYLACCQLRQYVINYFTNADFAIKCNALSVFDAISCPQPPASNDRKQLLQSDPAYLSVIQDNILKTVIMLVEFIRDCVCDTFLPSCPSDPGDDRLILACLTIKDDVITDICNFGCRQFAGGFPSFFYWLSLIPVIPLFKLLLDDLCCSPALLTTNSPLVNNLDKIDPSGNLLKTFTEGNFALPQMVMDRSIDVLNKFSLSGILSSVPSNQLNLAVLRGMPVKDALSSLSQFNVSFEERQVGSRSEIPLLPDTPTALGDIANPFAKAGDHVVLFETAGNVVEVQHASVANYTAMTEMSRQIAALQADIADLKNAQTKKK
jgi:hypothetical protein